VRRQPDEDAERYASLHDPRRRAVYEFVRGARRPVSRDEVADAVGLSRPLAVFHLERLMRSGLVDAHFARPEGRTGPGAGRPTKWYQAADVDVAVSVPARRYVEFGVMLAEAIDQPKRGASARESAVRIAADEGRRVGREFREETGDRMGRQAIQQLLAEIGFEPSTATRGPITLANCPFHRLAQAAPDVVCAMNEAFVAGLLDGVAVDSYRATLAPSPDRCCVRIDRA